MTDRNAAVIANNLARVNERIEAAAARVDRSPGEIKLVGITKYVDAAHAAALLAAGCTDLGESRPQELWQKAASLELADARWHLVGHLQRNKVRRTLPLVSLVHSVDSRRLLAEIDREALLFGRSIDVLLEVNTTGETQKHGLASEEVEPLLAAAESFPQVAICGLMTMAALEGGTDIARQNFAALRELRDKLRRNVPGCVRLDELSMGMSGDFEQAIGEGATILRVGSLLWEGC